MANYDILLLPGDGIGPEVIGEVEGVVSWLNGQTQNSFNIETELVGGSAIDAHGVPVTDATVEKADKAGAAILGAVGGPKWNGVDFEIRPEAGLLRLRKDLDLFANLRPAICYPALADASSLKREHVEGLDIMIVRELTGGTYFGEPKEITELPDGQKRGVDTTVYTTSEIERIVRVACDLAMKRGRKIHSSEKHNVMKTGVLWLEVAQRIFAQEYPDLEAHHILADNCAMQLIRDPKQFDVLVTDNLFGDMLSDEAAMMTGSLGMLPSASLGAEMNGKRKSLYEPVHGTAPDIAGKNLANPIASIASFGMSLRYTFNMSEAADMVDRAIANVLDAGLRTGDIMQDGKKQIGTKEMGAAIKGEMDKLAA